MDVDSASAEPNEVVNPGEWVTIHVENVPSSVVGSGQSAGLPFVLGSLLEHEQKLSVLNCGVTKAATFDAPVKSRDVVMMSCGLWRRPVRPAFSEDSVNSDKHKFERFLHAGRYSMATVYAPLTFGTNVPVVSYKHVMENTPP
jgi:pre-rRNA-processing protein TSR1